MSSEPSKNPKSYRTAGMLFLIGGLIFIIVAAVSGRIEIFLSPGVALFVIGIALWQHSKKLTNESDKRGD